MEMEWRLNTDTSTDFDNTYSRFILCFMVFIYLSLFIITGSKKKKKRIHHFENNNLTKY